MLKTFPINVVSLPTNAIVDKRLVMAVLQQIYSALKSLEENKLASAIDLRSIFNPEQTPELKKLLGQGEVSAKLNFFPPTEIEETGIAGVWWITHYDEHMKKFCEIIEITTIPALLTGSYEDIQLSTEQLTGIIEHYH